MNIREKAKRRYKWRGWLKEIGNDIGWLLTSHDIFEEIQKIVKSNELIQSPGLLHRWMTSNYAARVSISIRRLDDHNKRCISLYRLIEDIAENPDVITRNYYISRYPEWMRNRGLADSDFDKFAKKGSNLISKFKLKKDMRRLDKDTIQIRKFVNKWIAHRDIKRKKFSIPTVEDTKKALNDIIDNLFCKYSMLLTGGGLSTRKPTIAYDWKEPLRHPWIEMTEEEKKWRAKEGKVVWDKRN